MNTQVICFTSWISRRLHTCIPSKLIHTHGSCDPRGCPAQASCNSTGYPAKSFRFRVPKQVHSRIPSQVAILMSCYPGYPAATFVAPNWSHTELGICHKFGRVTLKNKFIKWNNFFSRKHAARWLLSQFHAQSHTHSVPLIQLISSSNRLHRYGPTLKNHQSNVYFFSRSKSK